MSALCPLLRATRTFGGWRRGAENPKRPDQVACWQSAYGALARSQLVFSNVTHNDFAVVADEKGTLPSWKAIKAALQSFDRAGLLGLVQDLYALDKGNKAFLNTRLGLGGTPIFRPRWPRDWTAGRAG
jgi:hypothetical protein